jgi:Asp-tRNA(Asn)/Glu-tRNA(Gln) amidotransferase A subunit family amidase
VIRRAAITGVYALKLTYDAVSLEGQKALAPTFDIFGFVARSEKHLQMLTNVSAIDDDEPCQDFRSEDFSIALMKTPMWSAAGPGTVSAVEQAAGLLRRG